MLSQACVSWAAKLTVSDRVWVRFKNQEKTPKENIYTSVVFLLSCNLVGITFADLIQQGVSVPVIRFYFRSNRFCYNAFVVVGSNCVLPVMSHTAFLVLWCGWVFFFFSFAHLLLVFCLWTQWILKLTPKPSKCCLKLCCILSKHWDCSGWLIVVPSNSPQIDTAIIF